MKFNRMSFGHVLHFVLLPIILVGSDLLIGFIGHYIGSTEQWISMETFTDYLLHINLSELGLVFLISIIVVFLVEYITRLK